MQNMIIKYPAMNRNTELGVRHGVEIIIEKNHKTGVYSRYHVHWEFRM